MEAKLVVIGGKANMGEVKLRLPMTIGRGKTADLIIAHPTVSREHCRLLEVEGALVVRDNGSSNGVYVDGKKVNESVVRPGQTLAIGPLTFRAEYEPEADLSKFEKEARDRSLADTTATDVDEFDFLMDAGLSANKPAAAGAKPSKPATAASAGGKGPAAAAKAPAPVKPGADPKKAAAPAGKAPAEKAPVAEAPAEKSPGLGSKGPGSKEPVAKGPASSSEMRDTAEVDLDEFWQDEVATPPAAKTPAAPPAKPAAAEAKKPAQATEPKEPKTEPKIGPPASTAADDFDFLAELDAPAKPSGGPQFEGLPQVDDVPDTAAWSVNEAARHETEATDAFNFDELFGDEKGPSKPAAAEPPVSGPPPAPAAEDPAKGSQIEPDFDLETPAATKEAWSSVEEKTAAEPTRRVESRDEDPFDFLKKETDADRDAARSDRPGVADFVVEAAPRAKEIEPDFDFLGEEAEPTPAAEPEASSSPTIEMPAADEAAAAEVDIRDQAAPSVADEPVAETPVAESPAVETPAVETQAAETAAADPWSFLETAEKQPTEEQPAATAKSDDEFDLDLLDEPVAESPAAPAEVEAEDELPIAAESEATSLSEEPVAEIPVAEKPVAETPVTKEPAAAEAWSFLETEEKQPAEQPPVAAGDSDDEFDLGLLDEPAAEAPAAPAEVQAKDEWPIAAEPEAKPLWQEPVAETPLAETPATEKPAAEPAAAEAWSFLETEEKQPPEQPPAAAARSDDEFDLGLLDEPASETPAEPAEVEATDERPIAVEPEAAPTWEEPVAETPVAEQPAAEPAADAWSFLETDTKQPAEEPPAAAAKADDEFDLSLLDEPAAGAAPSAAEPPSVESAAAAKEATESEPDFSAFAFDDDEKGTPPASESAAQAAPEMSARAAAAESEIGWPEPEQAAAPTSQAAIEPEPQAAAEAAATEASPAAAASADLDEIRAFGDFAAAAKEKERAMFSFLDEPAASTAETPSSPQEIAASATETSWNETIPTEPAAAGAADELDVTSFFGEEPAKPAADQGAVEASAPAAESEAPLAAFSPAPAAAPAAKVAAKKPAKPSLWQQVMLLFTGKKGKPAAKPAAKKPSAAPPPAAAQTATSEAATAPAFAPPQPHDAPIPLDDGPIAVEQAGAEPSGVGFEAVGPAVRVDAPIPLFDEPKQAPTEEIAIDFGDEPKTAAADSSPPPAAVKPVESWGESIPLADNSASEPWSAVTESAADEMSSAPPAEESVAASAPAPEVDWLASEAAATPAEPKTEESAAPAQAEFEPDLGDLFGGPIEEAGPTPVAGSTAAESAVSDTSDAPATPAALGDEPAWPEAEKTEPATADASVPAPTAAEAAEGEADFFSLMDEPAATGGSAGTEEQPWNPAATAADMPTAIAADDRQDAELPEAASSEAASSEAASSEAATSDAATSDAAAPLASSDSYDMATAASAGESAWSEIPAETEAEQAAWPAADEMAVAAASNVTESGEVSGGAISDFAPAPVAPERPRRPLMVDVDLRFSSSTRLLTPVALRRPRIEVPAMVPDVPAGRSFESKSRPPAAPESHAVEASPIETPAVETPGAEKAEWHFGNESRDLEATAAWTAAPAAPDDARSAPDRTAAADDWTLDLGEPAASDAGTSEAAPSPASEPQWDSPKAAGGEAAEVTARQATGDLDFFLDDMAAPAAEAPPDEAAASSAAEPSAPPDDPWSALDSVAAAESPWSAEPTGPSPSAAAGGPSPGVDEDALSFLQLDTGAKPPRAELPPIESASAAPAQIGPQAAPQPESQPIAAEPNWEIPAAETSSASGKEDELDFGFLDLEVTNAAAVEPAAKDEELELTLDFGDEAAIPPKAEATSPPNAEDTSAADDPFYFLRKPGEKPAQKQPSAAKPAGSKEQQNDKELDDFLSDLGM